MGTKNNTKCKAGKSAIGTRLMALALTLVLLLTATGNVFFPKAEAASYSAIKLNLPFYRQRISSDCGISSVAMVEAYYKGYTHNEDVVYEAVYQHNNRSVTLSSFSRLGYTKITSNSLADVYAQLQKNNPVIVYRKKTDGSTHFSVIYGYNGSTTTLEKKGFLVMNTLHPGNLSGNGPWSNYSYVDFETWLSGATWQYSLVRSSNKIPLAKKSTITTLTATNVTYPTYKKTDETFAVFGAVQSPYQITSAEVLVRKAGGAKQFGAALSNVTYVSMHFDSPINYFHIHSVDSKMTFASLSAGSYEYVVNVTDKQSNKLELVFPFTVGSSATVSRTLARQEATSHTCQWNSGVITKQPTCTATGVKTYTCATCGATKTEAVAALGHSYGYAATKAPTTSATGTLTGTCSKCSGTTTVTLPKLDTANYSYAVVTPATATATGLGRYTWKTTTYGTFVFDVMLDKLPGQEIPAGAPQILVSQKKAVAGDTVTVDIALKNNPGIASMKLKISYSDLLTLTDVTYNSAIGGQFQQPQTMASPVTLNWFNGLANTNGDWVYATLTFTVSDQAQGGEIADITVDYDLDDVYNIAETNINFYTVDGSVEICSYTPGDINGDGGVNNKDLTRLFQYLSDYDVQATEAALDVNGDGSVNNKDLTRLFQYLSGWDVEIY